MGGDGAHLGVGPERALKTILGSEPQPTEEETETVEQMRARIMAAPIRATSYDGTAMATARLILEAVEAGVPLDGGRDLYDRLKEHYKNRPEALAVFSELTGFLWGWAENAARRCLGAGPVPNPAIIEL